MRRWHTQMLLGGGGWGQVTPRIEGSSLRNGPGTHDPTCLDRSYASAAAVSMPVVSQAIFLREAGNLEFWDKISGFINIGSQTKETKQNTLLTKEIHVPWGWAWLRAFSLVLCILVTTGQFGRSATSGVQESTFKHEDVLVPETQVGAAPEAPLG